MPSQDAPATASPWPEGQAILVRGARVHNLRGIDVDIPRDRIVALTGVSGSGKSSLAFDTLFAEGQRRYLDGLSTYVRQFLDQLERPEIDEILGLPPTVAIDQKTGSANPRSTVATVTEISDYLRLLFARAGLPHCPTCHEPIRRRTPQQIVESVLALPEGQKLIILAPLVRGRKGEHREAFQAIRRAGLLRARVDGQTLELGDTPPPLPKTKTHDIEAVVDRLVVRPGIRPRLAESVDLGLKLGEGTMILSVQEGETWRDLVLSTRYACPRCGVGIEEVEPRTFSFNSPHGACPKCEGLGTLSAFVPSLILPDTSKSIATGAIAPWQALGPRRKTELVDDPSLAAFLKARKLKLDRPLAKWAAPAREALLQGDDTYPGLLPVLESLYRNGAERVRQSLEPFRAQSPCPACLDARLRPEALAVTLGARSIHDVSTLPLAEATAFLESLDFPPELAEIGPPLVREIAGRLRFLDRVGLGYLTLHRPADTLSGGELQRVRLATQFGSGLVGVCYVLDEPTAGLHPRDTDRLIASLRDLRDQGNTVVVVEHDEATVRAADWVIDIGPGAGPDGGLIVALGPPDAIVERGNTPSLTKAWLEGRLNSAHASTPKLLDRIQSSPGAIVIEGARHHNLRDVTATIPLGTLTCVTGVSGSGKSTLVLDILARASRRALDGAGPPPGDHDTIRGLDLIDKQITIDQAPIGRTARSTPATFTGLYDEIRRVFALTREAKIRGYGPGRFSFNVKGGRCEACEGQGVRRIEMSFLPDLEIACETCRGLRFNRATLQVRYKNRSIGEVLQMRVDAARELFSAIPRVRSGLDALHDAGLGYVTLGQSSNTLSGGEAQRVKLATELGRPSTGRTLYILDEPTTGLHAADVARLLGVLQQLVDKGNTVLVIEHQTDIIRASDWVIDLGPGAGAAGGQIVAEGPPAEIANSPASVTGPYLTLSAAQPT